MTSKFSKSVYFTGTSFYINTIKFTLTNKFSKSRSFTESVKFIKTNTFAISEDFSGTESFSRNYYISSEKSKLVTKASSNELNRLSSTINVIKSEIISKSLDNTIIPPHDNTEGKSGKGIIVGVSVGIVIAIIVIIIIILIFILMKRSKNSGNNSSGEMETENYTTDDTSMYYSAEFATQLTQDEVMWTNTMDNQLLDLIEHERTIDFNFEEA